jgi:hypothetical protein
VPIAYLERRILNEGHDGAAVLLRIRDVTIQLCKESSDGRSEQDYIRQLCPLVVDTLKGRMNEIWATDKALLKTDGLLYGSHLDSDVYVAAVYTQDFPTVAKWITRGKGMRDRSLLFGDPHRHAVKYGNHEVLAAMMTTPRTDLLQILRIHSLQMVARTGDLEATQFVFNFQSTQHPWTFSRNRSMPSYSFHNEQGIARLHTPNRAIFNFITDKRKTYCTTRTYGVKEHTCFLIKCARDGWVDMAAHYIALGASVNGLSFSAHDESSHDEKQRPILGACKKGHVEVVRLLLAHGADTCHPALETAVRYGQFAVAFLLLQHGAEKGDALAEGVAKGYRTIVQALLEDDTNAKLGLQDLLVHAVRLEDAELYWLLVEHAGGMIDEATRDACAKIAKEGNLESMARLIQSQPLAKRSRIGVGISKAAPL